MHVSLVIMTQILAIHLPLLLVWWWKTLFFHLVDMAIVNSFILFREQQQRFPDNDALKRPTSFSQANFREELVRDMCNFPKVHVPPQNTTVRPQPPADHFDMVHISNCVSARKQCVVCARERGQLKVNFYCMAPQCKGKHMHISQGRNCFQVFHSSELHTPQWYLDFLLCFHASDCLALLLSGWVGKNTKKSKEIVFVITFNVILML